MNAIDYMDYHPNQTNDQDITESMERKKSSIILWETGQYIPNTQTLSLADEKYLKLCLQDLKRVNLDLHKHLLRMKHF